MSRQQEVELCGFTLSPVVVAENWTEKKTFMVLD